MRAVNLLPSDERRASGARAGVGAYILVAVLVVAVIASAAFALANRSVSDRRHELARIEALKQAAAADAQSLQSYTTFAGLRQNRATTVRSLAASRFDWSHALHEVARTIPSNTWLTAMRATVSTSSQVEGGVTDPLRASLEVPAIELTGCTTSQGNVAGVVSNLRRIDGVQRVSLSSSEKLASASASAGATQSGSDDCRNGNTRFPKFSMTLFFEQSVGSTPKEKTP